MLTMTVAAAQAGLARKYNQFSDQGHALAGRCCANCVRKHFGGPMTCNDGWPCGDQQWQDRGARCINWTDRGNAPV